MTHTAPERNHQALQLQLLHSAREGHPACPVAHGTRVEVDGTVYAVHWTSGSPTSRTMKLNAQVTNLDTGKSMGIEGVISKIVKGGEQLCLPRKGTWMGREEAAHALAQIAAPHTQALELWNPVTGSVFVGVSL